ncbi:D-alanyl-D-alanine carboxypeptidase/D-alanyl-D-alanine endopeptidase [Sedimentisphaera cyanobacteriorum]|uniref:D-alanyl-D-alanine carboxypeptidase/D-alanyl-D-alanine endopeptidase n=1 Tax=Sedimentisphaera cyanobacteriorum TaxID=1940790 RepID=UPI0013736A4E|nr:D-alanyl-D-alanine carboxypeptidase/D-alanyl-D-alanine-endopeptidase [Sedimentisphaera cyanobacteriorum]
MKYVFQLMILLLAAGLQAGIAEKVQAVAAREKLDGVDLSVVIMDAESGQAEYQLSEKVSLIPASTMKLITTSAAIEKLGESYKYSTQVYCSDGGDLIIEGSGDPALGLDEDIPADISAEIERMGISEIRNIVADSTFFDDQLQHPDWPVIEINRSYQPEISGVSYRLNCAEFEVWPAGGQVLWDSEPETSFLKVNNQADYTSSRRNTVWISRKINKNSFTIHGDCGYQARPVEVPVHRPALFLACLTAEELSENGVNLTGKLLESNADTSGARLIKSYKTPLLEAVEMANSDSVNLAAECIAKTIPAENGLRRNQWENFAGEAEKFIASCGAELDGVKVRDGSGLSRGNRLTAEVLAAVLRHQYEQENFEEFKNTLAVGGVSGSGPVKRYFTQPAFKGRIFAKSGTMTGIKALAGYCFTDSGTYIFSIITNNANGHTRKAINDIVKSVF